jgi:hypothetical protein
MTSIEFLFNELWESPKDKLTWHTILNKAKEMHKQEIIDTYLLDELDSGKKYAEQYYQETFVSKGSDDKEMERKLLKSGFVDIVPKQETLYTEEQVIDAFKYAYLIGEDDISEDDAELEAKEYIQSLKQPKKD